MKILHVVGARPNFMKVSPVHAALSARPDVSQIVVHTGQHYDERMSDVFFRELGLPSPDVNLQVGSGSHAAQTGQIMMRFEEVALQQRPDLVLVYGDVNSTVAAALVCAKCRIRVGHVEAGLRSFDRTMPEEINRLVTDQIADLLFTPSADADENLRREGVAPERVHLVGNVMIDTLVRLLPAAGASAIRTTLGLQPKSYGVVTLHRPSNVDDLDLLASIVRTLSAIGRDLPLVFPVHPRTRRQMESIVAGERSPNIRLVDPLSYLEFLALQRQATLVITDSGGIQEETTYLGVPCLVMRDNTERPVVTTLGTSILVGRDLPRLRVEVERILAGQSKRGTVPPLWDGHAGERIAAALAG
jgi:UDP-N-acetylglucosamine 2-epimerase (non-hydrolysing)